MLFEDKHFTVKIFEWENELPLDKKRKYESQMAREALLVCLQHIKYQEPIYSDFLEIENHHHLKYSQHHLVSLAHSNQIAVAALALSKHYSSIGVDIEYCHRKIDINILKYFRNPQDTEVDPLKLWCQKEAVYKALDPIKNQFHELGVEPSISFTDIWIRENEFGLFNYLQLPIPLGIITLQSLNSKQGPIYLTLAGLTLNKEKK